ncbi:MAG: sigma-70 family RNA polymerase sigma factor [Acholeplasmatales bacterium]|nr:sigma-70 family RNA polymerase sigma factor [Acholeplasmatales bacterium]
MMKREDFLNKLVEKGNAAPIYISEITKVYPLGSEEFNYVQQGLDASDVELIDDSKDLDEGILEATEEIDETKLDISDLPFKGNLVSLYLKDIAPYPILSFEEEKELFSLVEKGKKAEEKLAKSLTGEEELSPEEYEAYDEIAHVAEDARTRIINCNLRLVVYNAKYYNNRGLAFMDLIQEGSMGLMVAINKFDYTRGFKFSTYATAWIRQAISRSLDLSSRTIRVPSHIIEKNSKIVDATRRLSQKLFRDPTDEEVAAEVGMPVDKLLMIKQSIIRPTSLEKPVGTDEESTLGDFVRDEDGLNPYEYAKRDGLHNAIREALSTLNEREANVLILRYGLDGHDPKTLEEVGLEFNVTRERIRQIESKAIKKLRSPRIMEMLKDFKNND